MDRKAKGQAYESDAERFLRRHGLRSRAANVRFRHGELDLVMDHGEILVFVEVRYRQHQSFGGATLSVGRHKQQRLARAAASYLAQHPSLAMRACRFDVVAFEGDHIEWIRDAFRLDSA
ncbi:YraN family protein [Pseudomarimonas arenosa]|uniref:UPF0102 protein IFO71_04755 n=1 Tax=Pseudomarimonas arenosa TaxID=2774145 RepID=A0AAW3ZG99_9GAMM|nr:YraN family protein [Pseudomarimonas arenosa]